MNKTLQFLLKIFAVCLWMSCPLAAKHPEMELQIAHFYAQYHLQDKAMRIKILYKLIQLAENLLTAQILDILN